MAGISCTLATQGSFRARTAAMLRIAVFVNAARMKLLHRGARPVILLSVRS